MTFTFGTIGFSDFSPWGPALLIEGRDSHHSISVWL